MGDMEADSMSELLALDAEAFCAALSQNWDTQQAASVLLAQWWCPLLIFLPLPFFFFGGGGGGGL